MNLSPDGNYLYVPDLGIDRIVIYRVDVAAGTLTRVGDTATAPGAGHRHFTSTRVGASPTSSTNSTNQALSGRHLSVGSDVPIRRLKGGAYPADDVLIRCVHESLQGHYRDQGILDGVPYDDDPFPSGWE